MTEWLAFGERYVTTFLDFWRLRSRTFIVERNKDISKYMSPYQFAIASFVVIFAIDLAAYSINKSDLIKASNLPMSIDTSEYALAVMATTFAIVTLVFSALFYFVISKIWPIRSFSAFTEILQFQCYMLSVELPMKVTFMYMMPWWGQLFMADDASLGFWIVVSVIFLYKIAILAVWGWPGIALIVDRSTLRVAIGSVFWSTILYGVFIAIIFAVALLYVIVEA